MSTYVPQIKGYIADVPKMWFRRCDGRVFHYDELTACNVAPSVDFMEVNTGWSSTPNAYLPGSGGITVDVTSAQFTPDIFAMANARNAQDADIVTPLREPEYFKVIMGTVTTDNSTHTASFDLTFPANADLSDYDITSYPVYNADGSIAHDQTPVRKAGLNGVEEFVRFEIVIVATDTLTVTETATAGVYHVAIQGSVITPMIPSLPNDTHVRYYSTVSSGKTIQIDNRSAAVGEVVLRWPVYNSGSDCTEAAIKGFQTLRIFRARVTTMPGMDDSYKEAGTYSLTLSGMDMKRSDGAIYKMAFERVKSVPVIDITGNKHVVCNPTVGTILCCTITDGDADPKIIMQTGVNLVDIGNQYVSRNQTIMLPCPLPAGSYTLSASFSGSGELSLRSGSTNLMTITNETTSRTVETTRDADRIYIRATTGDLGVNHVSLRLDGETAYVEPTISSKQGQATAEFAALPGVNHVFATGEVRVEAYNP